MHVAYVSADRGVPIGGTKGASIHVRGVVTALARRGHRVTVLAGSVAEPLRGPGVETIDCGFDRTLKEMAREIRSAGGRTLSREVHALLLGAHLDQRLGELDARCPVDAVYERHSLFSWAGLRFARRRRVPHGLEVNAPLVAEQNAYRELELAPVADALERRLVRSSDVVFVPSEELRAWVAGECGRSRRTWVLPNAVDVELFSRPSLRAVGEGELAGRFVVAFCGSLKPWHGIEELASAFSRVRRAIPEAHLLVVGDGPLRGVVEGLAERVGEEHVTLTGGIPHEEVPRWLARAHVAVAPYPALERFYFSPLKIVEYQAAGLPVVASRIGHVEKQIEDDRTGLLVEPGDAEGLARALVRLHANPALARRLGRRARRRVLASGGWDAVALRIVAALEQAAGRRPRGTAAGEAR